MCIVCYVMCTGSGMYLFMVLCVLLYIFVYWVLYVLFYCLVCIVVTSCVLGLVCIVLLSCVYCCYIMCILCVAALYTLDDGLLARGQYPEGPATGHLDTGFSWFPCVSL